MTAGGESPDALVARLERQAARDRASRLEAEVIAEVRLREAYERAAELELLAEVAVLVNESADAHDALARTARAARQHYGFAVAHVFVPDADGALVSADIWDADPAQQDFFRRCLDATLDIRFVPGEGLPGEVAASHEPRWLPDLARAANFLRRAALGGGAAWAFPVVVDTEVAAVVELLDPRPRAVDISALALSASLGVQLAHAFRWERVLTEARADRARLKALLARDPAPAIEADPDPEPVEPPGPPPPASASVGPVLVVDDNAVNRKLAGAMLARLGIPHDLVAGGEAALTVMTERVYRLVLMDVQMPGLDGRETTRRWRAEGGGATARDVPVVALTAHVGAEERALCADAGMDDYLSKPFGLADLEGVCTAWAAG